jgi:hypothetical protein
MRWDYIKLILVFNKKGPAIEGERTKRQARHRNNSEEWDRAQFFILYKHHCTPVHVLNVEHAPLIGLHCLKCSVVARACALVGLGWTVHRDAPTVGALTRLNLVLCKCAWLSDSHGLYIRHA